ncbi:putative G-protein coupled receptor 101 [Acipenser ruthenus]|uniref:Putative G-protein coupled receptor 101 n=1 Tax=Acipenser ruthenus TaxID=7906 RepID=A0A444UZP3_ACIRT|nr:putative G-protein coupled receptor 101 [Acipenser ruthenus]
MPSFFDSPRGYNSTPSRWDAGGAASLSSSLVNSVVKMALLSLIVCTSLFGNVVVLLVFQRKPQLLHVANRFVLNLLTADLFQTVLVMPFAIVATVPDVWPLDRRLCQALVVLMHLFAFAGVNTIIVVSVDRYLAIIHPLSYPARMTPRRGTNLIACTWVLSVLQSTPPLYGWGVIDFDRRHHSCTLIWSSSYSYSALVAVFSFWVPVCIMLGCYWMVFRAARRQNNLVHPVQAAKHNHSTADNHQCQKEEEQQQQQQPPPEGSVYPIRVRHRRFHYHCKAAKVVFVIMSSYIFSMGPYSVLGTLSISSSAPVPPWIVSLALVLFFFQCCIHPYIYGYMHRSVRREFLALLCGSFCKQVRPPRGSGADSCFTVTAGRPTHTHFPGAAARICPLRTWEEGTTSSSPTEGMSKESRKDTTSISFSSEKELNVLPK